jgi:hypothetical protein
LAWRPPGRTRRRCTRCSWRCASGCCSRGPSLFCNSPDQVAGGAAGQGLGPQPLERLRCLADQRGLVDRDPFDRRFRVDDNRRVIEVANEEPAEQSRVRTDLGRDDLDRDRRASARVAGTPGCCMAVIYLHSRPQAVGKSVRRYAGCTMMSPTLGEETFVSAADKIRGPGRQANRRSGRAAVATASGDGIVTATREAAGASVNRMCDMGIG